jgi:hypothetical protein
VQLYDAKDKKLKREIPLSGLDFMAVIDNLSSQPVDSHSHNLAKSLVAQIGYNSIEEFFTTHDL